MERILENFKLEVGGKRINKFRVGSNVLHINSFNSEKLNPGPWTLRYPNISALLRHQKASSYSRRELTKRPTIQQCAEKSEILVQSVPNGMSSLNLF